jgi:hypothetical protein
MYWRDLADPDATGGSQCLPTEGKVPQALVAGKHWQPLGCQVRAIWTADVTAGRRGAAIRGAGAQVPPCGHKLRGLR